MVGWSKLSSPMVTPARAADRTTSFTAATSMCRLMLFSVLSSRLDDVASFFEHRGVRELVGECDLGRVAGCDEDLLGRLVGGVHPDDAVSDDVLAIPHGQVTGCSLFRFVVGHGEARLEVAGELREHTSGAAVADL